MDFETLCERLAEEYSVSVVTGGSGSGSDNGGQSESMFDDTSASTAKEESEAFALPVSDSKKRAHGEF